MITTEYTEFKEYYDSNPDLDNAEYYDKYPETNKSTIRSWKSRAANIKQEVINQEKAEQAEGYEELEAEFIKTLMFQTESLEAEFKGVDNKSKLLILKNRRAAQEENNKNKKRDANTNILPNPAIVSMSKRKFGLDDYIVFDDKKGEIRMQIPMETLLDPEKNKALGEKK